MTSEQLHLANFILAVIGLVGGGVSVGVALFNAYYGKRKTRYEFLRDLYEDFLSPEILEKRNTVARFWSAKVHQSPRRTDSCLEVPDLSDMADSHIPNYIEERIGITIDPIDDAFVTSNTADIAKTEEVLNRYEHLAKLVELGVISDEEVKTFFYTMVADTFIVCLPFILYRRVAKPSYAHKMQRLLEKLPKVSLDLARV